MSGGTFTEDDIAAVLPKVRAFVSWRVSDKAKAEDIVSATLERAWRYQRSYNPAKPLTAWLKAIARNVLIDHAEAQEKRPEDASSGQAEYEFGVSVHASQTGDGFSAFTEVYTVDTFRAMIGWLRSRGIGDEGQRLAGVMFLGFETVEDRMSAARIEKRHAYYRELGRLKQVARGDEGLRLVLGYGSDTFGG